MEQKAEYVGVLQARMESSRLPGKLLMEVCGEPIIQIMLKRMKYARGVSNWVLATTDNEQDHKLVEIAKAMDLLYFRGSEDDVLDRLYQCAKNFDIKYMVRIGADNPLLDYRVVDDTIKKFMESGESFDYFSNHHPPTFPDGQEVEIIPFRSLEIEWKEASRPHEREHATPFLWDQPERFKIGNYEYPGKNLYLDFRWTLDYEEDFNMIKAVLEELYPIKPDFSMEDVLELLEIRPDIAAINSIHHGKTWHLNEKDNLSTIEQYPQNKMTI